MAEENTPTLAKLPRHGRRLWIIDPIDGTRGFAMKNGEFCTMLGLAVDGRPVLGVVIEPGTGRETYAAKGHGCWTALIGESPQRCVVRNVESLLKSTLVKSHGKPGKVSASTMKLGPAKVMETYSAGIKLALVARGAADLYHNGYPAVHDWDACAGHALVEEAGGAVLDTHGMVFTYGLSQNRTGMLAGAPNLVAKAIQALKSES
jgi:3'(2'), 5'-bisphosphate nucleotidase